MLLGRSRRLFGNLVSISCRQSFPCYVNKMYMSSTCDECSAPLQNKWFCNSCKRLQTPSSNYFELLECEKSFTPPSDLSKQYANMQKQIHPDRFHSYGSTVVQQAERISAQLNNAYATLKDPIARSKYLLELEGIEYGEDIPPPGPEFLMNVMDIREEIEDTNDHKRLRALQDTLTDKQSALEADLSKCYQKCPIDSSEAIDLTSRLIYVDKLLKAIYDRLPSS